MSLRQPHISKQKLSPLSLLMTGLVLLSVISVSAHSMCSEPPLELKTIRLSQESAAGGSQIVGVVTISRRAPAQGIVVRLRSSDPALASIPKSVTVPKGRKSAPFFIWTRPVSSEQKITLTGIFGETKTAVFTLHPPGIAEVTVTPDTVAGGENAIGDIRMEAVLGRDTDVELSCDDTSVKLEPTHTTIKKGETRIEFSVITTAVKQKTSVKITAKAKASTGFATLIVTP